MFIPFIRGPKRVAADHFLTAVHSYWAGAAKFLCLPRCDAEPVFSTLLDAENGGRFCIGAGGRGNQRFLPYDDPRLAGTINAIAKNLDHGGWLLRYSLNDGFGKPSVAFVICTFWLIEALARAGRREEARTWFDRIHAATSPLGLLSEDYDPINRRIWGNFPQTYSHVGMIHAAFAASPQWDEVL